MSDFALSSVDDDRFCTAKRGEELPCDNSVYKFIASIPLIGEVANIMISYLLRRAFYQEKNPGRAIQLIDLKNTYKICSVFRTIMTGLCFLDRTGAVLIGSWVLALLHYQDLTHNQKVMGEISVSGVVKPGLKIR